MISSTVMLASVSSFTSFIGVNNATFDVATVTGADAAESTVDIIDDDDDDDDDDVKPTHDADAGGNDDWAAVSAASDAIGCCCCDCFPPSP